MVAVQIVERATPPIDFTGDLKDINGQPIAKRGRSNGSRASRG